MCSYSTDAQTIDQQVTFDEGEPGLIPCRPAHPKFNVTLERKTPREVLSMTCTNYVTICNTTKVNINPGLYMSGYREYILQVIQANALLRKGIPLHYNLGSGVSLLKSQTLYAPI